VQRRAKVRRGRADKRSVDALVLVTTIAGSMTLAVVGARGMLIGVLHVMANPPRPSAVVSGMRAMRGSSGATGN
jgi:hypothetical protein